MYSFEELLSESLVILFESTKNQSNAEKQLIKTLQSAEERVRAPKPQHHHLMQQQDFGDWVVALQDPHEKLTKDNSVPLKTYPADELKKVILYVTQRIGNSALKYRPYIINQIALGNIRLTGIRDDADRFVVALEKFYKLLQNPQASEALKKAAIQLGIQKADDKKRDNDYRNLYNWPNILDLERVVTSLHEETNKYDEEDKSSSFVIHQATYVKDNKAAIDKLTLLNRTFQETGIDPQEVPPYIKVIKKYFLRRVLTMSGCIKYGKGTTWCTSASRDLEGEVRSHTSDSYLPRGIFQIERQIIHKNAEGKKQCAECGGSGVVEIIGKEGKTKTCPECGRVPILQFTPSENDFEEMKNVLDKETTPKADSDLYRFLSECLEVMTSENFQRHMQPEVTYQSRPNFSYNIDDARLYTNLINNLQKMLGKNAQKSPPFDYYDR